MTTFPEQQVAGMYHRRIGEVLVTALSDGYLDASYAVLRNLDAGAAEAILAEAFRPAPPRISVNCFLLRTRGRAAVVDTGSAQSMGPTLGRLPSMLAAAGVAPADIDTVLLTHVHPDHSNGLTDAGGRRLFPNAELIVSHADIAHWDDDAAMARANESQRLRYFEWGRFQTAPYRDRMRDAVGEVFPHVTAVPLAGHTPGHTGYMVSSGAEAMLIWGDTVHIPDIQIRRPEVTMIFDTDPDAAASARRRTLDMVATDRLLVGGMHVHFPGFAHVVRRNEGYAIEPESWAFTI